MHNVGAVSVPCHAEIELFHICSPPHSLFELGIRNEE